MSNLKRVFWSCVLGYTLLINPAQAVSPTQAARELYCPTTYCDYKQAIAYIFVLLLKVVPIVSVVMVIVSGFRMVLAQGREEQLIKAKRALFWVIGGLVFSLLAFSIIAIIQDFLGANI